VTSIELFHRDPLAEIDPVETRRHSRPARMANRGDRGRLVDHREQVPPEQVAQHILHVRHHERGELGAGE
jgi:hypothetical protein